MLTPWTPPAAKRTRTRGPRAQGRGIACSRRSRADPRCLTEMTRVSSRRMDLRPGARVDGRYRVDRKVGSGGMGEVWAGEHVALGIKIAVKRLLPAAAVDHQIVARFKREAYLLGRIRSDHVARVIDFMADNRF